MKYTIFSIDDSRKHYTDAIRETLSDEWDEVSTEVVDARNGIEPRYPVRYRPGFGTPRLGHFGIWHTVLNSFEHAPHVTFEDDAKLGQDFEAHFYMRLKQLPADADFFSLFLPRDSDNKYRERLAVSRSLTRTYQRYGGVSMYYTPKGTEKIVALLERDGFIGQYDDTLYHYSKTGELRGYCSKPVLPDLVYITGEERSIVQETPVYAG